MPAKLLYEKRIYGGGGGGIECSKSFCNGFVAFKFYFGNYLFMLNRFYQFVFGCITYPLSPVFITVLIYTGGEGEAWV